MFTIEQRDNVRDRVLEMARTDPRVTGGALTGSMAIGAEDEWSDIDVTFGVADGTNLEAVLDDWTGYLSQEFGALHYWDLPSGPSIYRVLLLPNGLEIDASVTPEQEFGARGPRFRPLFGNAPKPEIKPQAPGRPPLEAARYPIGLDGTTYCTRGLPSNATSLGGPNTGSVGFEMKRSRSHASASERRRPTGAGLIASPAAVTEPLTETLVRSLDEPELRRALLPLQHVLSSELVAWDPALCTQLKPPLQEFGLRKTCNTRNC